MRKLSLIALSCALSAGACAPSAGETTPDDVRLVVMISVDQLRDDLLDHYRPVFSDGLARLLEGAWRFTGASHNHASTATAVGHATLATGMNPNRHGLVGNSWREETAPGESRSVYSVLDTLSPILGVPRAPGRSPRNLYVDGLADWMMDADAETRILSISKKDRAAIPMAGKTRGHVYWIDDRTGRFVTSTYYRERYPDWVQAFNDERMPSIMERPVWEQTVPPEFRALARGDEAPYEADGEHTVFPHDRRVELGNDNPGALWDWAFHTPFQHEAIVGLLEVGMEALELGQSDGRTDFLALSFSGVDYVGHRFGPFSQEQLDNLHHLDRMLGDVLRILDEKVGEGRWVLALSADHGVVDTPEWSAAQGGPGRRITRDELRELREVTALAAEAPGTEAERRQRIAEAAEALDWVVDVYLPEEVTAPEPADTMAALYGRSHSDVRRVGLLSRYGLHLRHVEGSYPWGDLRGTGHGSPYWYDRHVPFIIYGSGIEPGISAAPVYTYDVAPTLAGLAGVPVPSGIDGQAVHRISRIP